MILLSEIDEAEVLRTGRFGLRSRPGGGGLVVIALALLTRQGESSNRHPRAQIGINEIQAADDWGLPSEAFDLPPAGHPSATAQDLLTDSSQLNVGNWH